MGPIGPVCSGPFGPGPCGPIFQQQQQFPQGLPPGQPQFYQPQRFSITGQQAQQVAINCAQQSGANLNQFVSCAGHQIILTENQQILVDCAARSGGQTNQLIACAGSQIFMNQLNPEQQIAVQCVVETSGQPYAAASCTASRLTERELQKCLSDGIGGPNGCFGDNNDLVGRNGWTARTFANAVSDIQNGPGVNNDLVGQNGFVVRTRNNINNDIQNGPGKNNDLVGCNGFVNKALGGGC